MRNPGIFLNDNTAREAGPSHLRMLCPDPTTVVGEKKEYHEIEDRKQRVKSLMALSFIMKKPCYCPLFK